jgi:hypothetical protein
MKHVTVFYEGHELKQFDCEQADITGRSVLFHGVPKRDGTGTMTVRHFDDLTHEVDFYNRVARVYSITNDLEIVVSW